MDSDMDSYSWYPQGGSIALSEVPALSTPLPTHPPTHPIVKFLPTSGQPQLSMSSVFWAL